MVISSNSDEAGAPRHVESIVCGLKHKFKFVVVFGEHGPVSKRLDSAGFRVHIVPGLTNTINPYKDYICFKSIRGIVKKVNPDVIHCHSAKAGVIGRFVACSLRKPIVYTVHGWGWRGLDICRGAVIWGVELLLTLTPKLKYIYVARNVNDEARKYLFIPNSKAIIIYNGVKEIKCLDGGARKKLTILMPARVCSAKDHVTILKAFEKLNSDSTNLLFCGQGTNSTEFIKMAKNIALTRWSQIMFMGQQSDMNEIYSRCDVVALISKFEALPLSLIEGMSCGKGLVATNVGGVSELIENNYNGYLVDVMSVEQIVSAFELYHDENIIRLHGRRSEEKYHSKYTNSIMLEKIVEVYSSFS